MCCKEGVYIGHDETSGSMDDLFGRKYARAHTFDGLWTKCRWQLCLTTWLYRYHRITIWLYWHSWERAACEKKHFIDDSTHTPAIATTHSSAHAWYCHPAGQCGASGCPRRDHFHPQQPDQSDYFLCRSSDRVYGNPLANGAGVAGQRPMADTCPL